MQKGLCQCLGHKFPQNNIGGVFIDLILYGWMTLPNEFSGSAPGLMETRFWWGQRQGEEDALD